MQTNRMNPMGVAVLACLAGAAAGYAVGERAPSIQLVDPRSFEPRGQRGPVTAARNHRARTGPNAVMRPEHYHQFDGVLPPVTRQMRRAADRAMKR